MLVTIQFPFADLRKFLAHSGQLNLPEWPLPVPDTQFVRHFGSIRLRKLGGIADWVGENEVCEANRALRFCGDLSLFNRSESFRLPLRCAFRRLYFDGWAVGKFEVGISPKKHGRLSLSKDKSDNLIKHILQFPVEIKNPSGSAWAGQLIKAGKHLAQSYLAATTALNSTINPEDWWVSYGTPLVFLHCGEKEHIELPDWVRPIELPQYNLRLLQCQIQYNRSQNVLMWVLSPTLGRQDRRSSSRYDKERKLRICLLRLHAEHECFRLVLRDIQTDKISIALRSRESDNLQHYLNNAITRISRLEAEAAREFDTEIVDIARESMNRLNPGQRDALLNTLEGLDIRKNAFHKIAGYTAQLINTPSVTKVEVHMGDTYNVHGQNVVGVGQNVQAHDMTFNQITNQSSDTMDLQKLAEQLSVLRSKMKVEAVELEQDTDVGVVAAAEIEAKKGNGPKVLELLAKTGKWTLDTATNIGVTVAVAALKEAMGIK